MSRATTLRARHRATRGWQRKLHRRSRVRYLFVNADPKPPNVDHYLGDGVSYVCGPTPWWLGLPPIDARPVVDMAPVIAALRERGYRVERADPEILIAYPRRVDDRAVIAGRAAGVLIVDDPLIPKETP